MLSRSRVPSRRNTSSTTTSGASARPAISSATDRPALVTLTVSPATLRV